MSNIRYITGNILSSKAYSRILIHACNCGGSWGGGIALQLAISYPKAEKVYINFCEKYGNKLLGKCLFIPAYRDPDLLICCLFTAEVGGANHDFRSSILKYTEQALNNMQVWIYEDGTAVKDCIAKNINYLIKDLDKPLRDFELEMPKINSGIFGIPWEKTESILEKFTSGNEVLKFTVYSL